MSDLPPVWELRRDDDRYYRARRQSHRERGLCLNCCSPAILGKARCAVCAARIGRLQAKAKHRALHRRYMKRRYHARARQGECPVCGRVLGMYDDPRFRSCRDCRAKAAAAQAERFKRVRAERRERGLCLRCGKRPPEAEHVNCGDCRAKNAANALRWYHRARGREMAT